MNMQNGFPYKDYFDINHSATDFEEKFELITGYRLPKNDYFHVTY